MAFETAEHMPVPPTGGGVESKSTIGQELEVFQIIQVRNPRWDKAQVKKVTANKYPKDVKKLDARCVPDVKNEPAWTAGRALH